MAKLSIYLLAVMSITLCVAEKPYLRRAQVQLAKAILNAKWDHTKLWSADAGGTIKLSLTSNYKLPLRTKIGGGRGYNTIDPACSTVAWTSGVYMFPVNGTSYRVYCDMDTAGGGWTVFQDRRANIDSFPRGWHDYKVGFGTAGKSDYWLGNEALFKLTRFGMCSLRVEVKDQKNQDFFAEYDDFKVADEANGYRLTVGKYRGTAGDGLSYHNGMKFSTRDKDNLNQISNCAANRSGAWWYKDCEMKSNLNALYSTRISDDDCYHWKPLHGTYNCLRSSRMMLRCT